MFDSAKRYWFVGLLLTVGVWGGWLPATRALAGTAAAPAKTEAAPAKTEAAPAQAETSVRQEGPAAAHKTPAQGASTEPCARGTELLAEYTALYNPKLELKRADYLLALVPDPALGEHGGLFASVVEGVEEAVAAQGFVRDRMWLPWQSAPDCVESAPGWLLFRPERPSETPPLVVLLVGETPTWGVRTMQLSKALEQVKMGVGSEPLNVLGPTFSGSAASLVALTRPFVEQSERRLHCISGTATGPRLPEQLKPVGDFRATVPDDAAMLGAMLGYLRARGGSDGQIAVLREGSTAYGTSVSGQAAGGGVPVLSFPVDLGPLRAAVASAPSPDVVSAGGSTNVDPHVLVLDDVSRDLSYQRVRFVGVIATEPSDVILLTRRLRAKLPDVRFFTLGSDIQFTNPELASPLNGMLVAHAAPPAHLAGSISLKSEVVRGVYLAGRALLGDPLESPRVRISLIGNGTLWQIGGEPTLPKAPVSWRVVEACAWIGFLLAVLCAGWPFWVERWPRLSRIALARQHGPLSLALAHCERTDLRADDAWVTASWLSAMAGPPLLMILAELAHGPYARYSAIGVSLIVLFCWARVILQPSLAKTARGSAILCSLLALVATVLALGIGCGPLTEATLNLMSGGSGVLAGLLGFAMMTLGLWCWRVRLRFLDTHRFSHATRAEHPPLAEALAEEQGKGSGLFELEKELLEVTISPWGSLPAVPVAVHVLLFFSVLLVYTVRVPVGFEPGWRNHLVIAFGLISLLPITVNFSRIVATWVALSRLLRRLALLPILEPMRELPKELKRNLEQQLTVPHAELCELARPIELLRQLGAIYSPLRDASDRAAATFQRALQHQASESTLLPAEGLEAREHGQIVDALLAASNQLRARSEPANEELRKLEHAFLATLVAIFVPRYLRHFRLYVMPVLVGSVLGVLMTSLYFVQPQRLITSVIFVWVTGMVLVSFWIYSSLDRTPVISAIGNTTEGAVDFDWTLVSRIVTWGLVPLLSLFAAQYPSFSNAVSWLANGLGKALR